MTLLIRTISQLGDNNLLSGQITIACSGACTPDTHFKVWLLEACGSPQRKMFALHLHTPPALTPRSQLLGCAACCTGAAQRVLGMVPLQRLCLLCRTWPTCRKHHRLSLAAGCRQGWPAPECYFGCAHCAVHRSIPVMQPETAQRVVLLRTDPLLQPATWPHMLPPVSCTCDARLPQAAAVAMGLVFHLETPPAHTVRLAADCTLCTLRARLLRLLLRLRLFPCERGRASGRVHHCARVSARPDLPLHVLRARAPGMEGEQAGGL